MINQDLPEYEAITNHISQENKKVTEEELVKLAFNPNNHKPKKEKEYGLCLCCGKEILKTKSTRQYCDNACRVKASMKKNGKKVMLVSMKEYEMIIEFRKQNPELNKKTERKRKWEQGTYDTGLPSRKLTSEEKKSMKAKAKKSDSVINRDTEKEVADKTDITESTHRSSNTPAFPNEVKETTNEVTLARKERVKYEF
jgi:hypothetical protein